MTIIEERALILYEKLIRVNVPFWDCYENVTRHLKTQSGFLQRVFELRIEIELDDGIVQGFLKPSNPVNHVEITTKLTLAQPILKSQSPQSILKILRLETIHTLYPEPEWLHVYTDGFLTELAPNVGAGIFSSIFSFYMPVGKQKTAFDGEITAILVALEQLVPRHLYNKVVILSDSKAAKGFQDIVIFMATCRQICWLRRALK